MAVTVVDTMTLGLLALSYLFSARWIVFKALAISEGIANSIALIILKKRQWQTHNALNYLNVILIIKSYEMISYWNQNVRMALQVYKGYIQGCGYNSTPLSPR